MLLTSKLDTKETIVSLLSKGSLDSVDLQKNLQNKNGITKQGFYKALRELLKEEVVIKNKQALILSNAWLNRLQAFATHTEKNYTETEHALSLQEGDSMTFKFKSILDLDLLWMHYFYIFAKNIDSPVVFFSSHEFWGLFRSDIQNELYKWTQDNNKKTYLMIGAGTNLDIETTLSHKKYGIEIAYEKDANFNNNIGLTIIGDYIFHTVLDRTTTNAIDGLYQKYTKWQPIVQQELEEIISRMRRSKVVIERNKKKAEQLRKKIMKYFVFYK